MRILVFTPVWKRPEITEIWCLGILRLKKKFDLDAFCVVSPEDETHNRLLLDKYGIDYCEHPNKLGAKKNCGLNEAMKKDFDYLMELNSDDLIKDELIDVYADLMEDGESFIGINNFVFYNSKTGKGKECTSNTLFGIGRAYKKSMLERETIRVKIKVNKTFAGDQYYFKAGNAYWVHPEVVGPFCEVISEPRYMMWDDSADRGMDNFSKGVLERRGVTPKVVKTDEPLAIDVKSDINLWRYEDMPGEKYLTGKMMLGLSDDEKNLLNALRQNK